MLSMHHTATLDIETRQVALLVMKIKMKKGHKKFKPIHKIVDMIIQSLSMFFFAFFSLFQCSALDSSNPYLKETIRWVRIHCWSNRAQSAIYMSQGYGKQIHHSPTVCLSLPLRAMTKCVQSHQRLFAQADHINAQLLVDIYSRLYYSYSRVLSLSLLCSGL